MENNEIENQNEKPEEVGRTRVKLKEKDFEQFTGYLNTINTIDGSAQQLATSLFNLLIKGMNDQKRRKDVMNNMRTMLAKRYKLNVQLLDKIDFETGELIMIEPGSQSDMPNIEGIEVNTEELPEEETEQSESESLEQPLTEEEIKAEEELENNQSEQVDEQSEPKEEQDVNS